MMMLFAFLIGFFAGLRSLAAPAMTAWAVYLGWLKLERPLSLIGSLPAVAIFTLLAVVELVADKTAADTEPHSAAGAHRAHRDGWVSGCMRCRRRSARNFYRRAAWCRRRCCGLFRRIPGANTNRESVGYAGHLRRAA